MMQRIASWIFCALTFGAVLATVESSYAQPVRGGTLTVVQPIEPPALVSAVNTSTYLGTVSTKIFEGLVEYDDKLKPRPALAESWSISADGKTYTFRLRKGVKWHDGIDFTAADVQFSLMEVWKKVHGRGRSTYDKVVSVTTPDPYTVVVQLSVPSPTIMSALSSYESQVIPKHIYGNGDISTNPALNAPIGTGPFKFVEWKKGEYIRLARNPDYWDKPKPYLDEIIFRVIPDGSARAASLESGETLLGVFNPVPLADVARISKVPDLSVDSNGYAMLSPMYLMEFNLGRERFRDRKVRQAIAYAIDKSFIVKNVWYGVGKPATGPIASTSPYYTTKDVPQYPFSVDTAKKLLDEAGLAASSDGTRFSMTLDSLRDPETLRTAEYVKQALKRVGIQVELRNHDLGTFIRQVYGEYDFDMTLNFFSLLSDPTLGMERLYVSSNIRKGTPFSNGSQYRSEQMDSLLNQARIENDPEKRMQEFHDVQRLVQQDLPIINVLEIQFLSVINKKVKGYNVSGEGPYASFKEVYLGR
jgi:peptide/nickel transport system substrate-binding protein